MREKVILGLFLIRFQGSIEDGLESGSGCRRGWYLRHRKSNSDELVSDGRETERLSKQRGSHRTIVLVVAAVTIARAHGALTHWQARAFQIKRRRKEFNQDCSIPFTFFD